MNNTKNWFEEDEDDIFIGSPKSKFFDIARNSSNEVVDDELDKIIEKYAAMELLLTKDKDENFDLNKFLAQYTFENADKVNEMKKGLYIEFTGEIICRLDS